MPTQVKYRRGSTVDHSTFTGAAGEMTVDTTQNTLVVHDGSTVGGFPLGLESDLTTEQAKITGIQADVTTLEGDVAELQTYPYRNMLINGNMDIWQRGITATGNATFAADRWMYATDGTTVTQTVTQQTFTPGQTDVPNGPTYFLRLKHATTPSGASWNGVVQRIENAVRPTAGRTVSASVWLKSPTPTVVVGLYFAQRFGTGGSPSASHFESAPNQSLTSSWAKYTFTATMPSVSSKTFGTNFDDSLELGIMFDVNAAMEVDIAQAQVVISDEATDFEIRSFASELALCQRYCETSYDIGVIPGSTTQGNYGVEFGYLLDPNGSGTRRIGGTVQFKVAKRTTPTIYRYNPLVANQAGFGASDGGGTNINITAQAPGRQKTKWFTPIVPDPTTMHITFHWVAEAEML